VQFGLIGDQLARQLLGIARPRVGLLSIGEEAGKGNDLVRSAHRGLSAQDIEFLGNVEARDLYQGGADVVVCDGFTGNILLKTSEAAVETLRTLMREEFARTIAGKIGGLFARGAFARLRKRVDYEEFGGALLVGVRGLTVISHGRSTPRALGNAIGLVEEYARHDLNSCVETALAGLVTVDPTETASIGVN
jgi:glycerol-3-phosphate acyltransferase PlsX